MHYTLSFSQYFKTFSPIISSFSSLSIKLCICYSFIFIIKYFILVLIWTNSVKHISSYSSSSSKSSCLIFARLHCPSFSCLQSFLLIA